MNFITRLMVHIIVTVRYNGEVVNFITIIRPTFTVNYSYNWLISLLQYLVGMICFTAGYNG